MTEPLWNGWFDGACAPSNPGQRAIGALLVSPAGVEHTVSRATGRGTNNEAEYQALIALLELAIEHNATPLRVHGDSKLVVFQARGIWGVNTATLRPYHQQVVALSRRLTGVTLQWVPRDQNANADALASAALPPEAHATPPPRGADWGTLTDVGKPLQLSAIAVGRRLDALGLRGADRAPTSTAVDEGLARVYDNGFGLVASWNIPAVTNRLRG